MTLLCLAALSWSAYSLIQAAEAAPCASGITNLDVATANDLEQFVEALACNETAGVFNVTWYGRQQVDERIDMSDMKDVTITGVALDGIDPAAANDAGSTTGLFVVDGGSTLSLRSLVLDGGQSQEGAAISVDASVVNAFDCGFTNNNASEGGDTCSGTGCCNILRRVGTPFLKRVDSVPRWISDRLGRGFLGSGLVNTPKQMPTRPLHLRR